MEEVDLRSFASSSSAFGGRAGRLADGNSTAESAVAWRLPRHRVRSEGQAGGGQPPSGAGTQRQLGGVIS